LPTVLVDGFVSATWTVDRKSQMQITPLRRLSKAERAKVDEEAELLRDFYVS
jgi:hypothetical protein